jgi:hypothetical protein
VISSSYLDTTFQIDAGDTSTGKYIYNGNNQLIQSNIYVYSSSGISLYNSTNYTYDNLGNVLSTSNNQGRTESYSYYTDLPYTLKINLGFLPPPINFVKTEIVNSGGSVTTTTHYYTFDSQNRLTEDSTYAPEIDLTVIKSYKY